MAKPANPLDIFSTYTTHFELHAAGSWDELKEVAARDEPTKQTTRRESNGTLLINTRMDAHQTIDNVRYRQIACDGDPTATMVASGDLTLEVVEPNGMFFVEKIRQHAKKYSVRGLTDGLVFGLKIIFVGRKPDNAIVTLPLKYIIPMQLTGFDSKFDFKGGHYSIKFVMSAFASAPTIKDPTNTLHRAVAYVNKNITIKAKTVNEALQQLEEKLNENYEKTYQTELKNAVGAKSIKYVINNYTGLDGELSLVMKNSMAPGDDYKLSFSTSVDITSMIRQIMYSSKTVNEIISESKSALKNSYHKGVKIPTFTPRYNLTKDSLEVAIDIRLYEGSDKSSYEFDFLFGEPGKNVDVMDFDVKFPNMIAWMSSKTKDGSDKNNNFSGTVPKNDPLYWSNNIVTLDKTVKKLISDPIEPYSIPVKAGNVGFLNQVPTFEKNGLIKMENAAVPSTRLAFDARSELVAASGIQISFSIRGHLGLLENCIPYPDGTKNAFGTTTGLWVKVNIKDQDKQPIFYTDPYRVMTVDNIFSSGKFTQIFTVIMGEPT